MSVNSGRFEKLTLAAAAAAFLALAAWFWPPMYLVSDEAGNFSLAYVLGEGTVFADVAGRPLPEAIAVDGGHSASRYPPGLAALLVPLTWLGPRALFALPLVAHLAGFAILAWLLRRAGVSPLWALLWLFYPTAVLHSRMLMSNLPEAVILLGAFALVVRGGRWAALAAGLLLGLGLVVRPTLAVGAAALAVGALWRGRREILAAPSLLGGLAGSEAGWLLLGALPGLAALLAYNGHVFGSPFDFGYRRTDAPGRFSAGAAGRLLPRYLIFLLAAWPLMLPAPAFYRGKWRLETALVPAAYLLLYGTYDWPEDGASLPETLLRQSRFVLAAVPFLLLAYAGVLSGWLNRLPGLERAALALFLVAGLCGAGYLGRRHLRAQEQAAAARDALYTRTDEGALVVANVQVAKLLHDAWGRGQRRMLDYSDFDRHPEVLTAEVRAGRPAFLATLRRPGRQDLAGWDSSVRQRLEKEFTLAGEERPAGGWTLGVWRLQALSGGDGLGPRHD